MEQQAIKEMEEKESKKEGELQEGWTVWNTWAEQRRKVAKMVTRDKKAHVDSMIKSIGTPDGPENIWKAIETIAPRSRHNKRALEKEDGGICFNKEEEIEELKKYCQKHLGQKEHQPENDEEYPPPPKKKNMGMQNRKKMRQCPSNRKSQKRTLSHSERRSEKRLDTHITPSQHQSGPHRQKCT